MIYLFNRYSDGGYCVAAKIARVLSSVHAYFVQQIMTSALIHIWHINSDNEWPRDFSELVNHF